MNYQHKIIDVIGNSHLLVLLTCSFYSSFFILLLIFVRITFPQGTKTIIFALKLEIENWIFHLLKWKKERKKPEAFILNSFVISDAIKWWLCKSFYGSLSSSFFIFYLFIYFFLLFLSFCLLLVHIAILRVTCVVPFPLFYHFNADNIEWKFVGFFIT